MYYAVKKVINSNPEALERQYVGDYAELSNNPQYADLTKEEKRARSAYAICTILILPAFVAATALSVSPAPTSLFAFIPLALLILSVIFARKLRSKKSEVTRKKSAVFCSHVAFASEYYDAVRGNRIIACYGKPHAEDADCFELTIVTIPKSQPRSESEDAPTEHTISFPFCGDSLSLANHDNLVLDLDHEVLCFME